MGLVGFGFHIGYFLHLQATSCISFLAFKMTILKCKITFWNDYGFWLLEWPIRNVKITFQKWHNQHFHRRPYKARYKILGLEYRRRWGKGGNGKRKRMIKIKWREMTLFWWGHIRHIIIKLLPSRQIGITKWIGLC